MTAVPVRNTPFASWIDEDAWMESMKGARWEALLKEEERLVQTITNKEQVKKRQTKFLELFKKAQEETIQTNFYVGAICVHWYGQFFKIWNWLGTTKTHEARDVLANFTHVWSIEDIGQGAEEFELRCYTSACKESPTWKKKSVGPDVGYLEGRLYYLKARNKLQYYQLWSCDADTGKNEKLHYTEQNPEVNCSLERQGDGLLFFLCENSQEFIYYQIHPSGTLVKKHEKYPILRQWILPLHNYGVEFVWPDKGLVITKQHGMKTLWHCSPKASAKKILQITAGDILLDPYAVWNGILPCHVRVEEPDVGQKLYSLDEHYHLHLLSKSKPTDLISVRVKTKSADQKDVYGILTTSSKHDTKKLLAIGYGAYGMPTSIGSVKKRWAPLLENGWAILHTFIRGGGDHNEAWAKAGRLSGREKTVDDFVALVQEAQEGLNIKPSYTAIYGRSAGGLLVGEVLRRFPDGELMRAIYTEVPYVDELRTTTNKELPLTVLEHNEFGNPSMRLSDFLHVGLTSPADSASVLSTPKIFVLARTSLNDSQVYAYEPLKWVRRLRANSPYGQSKLCIVEREQGHFTPPDKTIQQWAIDCAVLDAWASDF